MRKLAALLILLVPSTAQLGAGYSCPDFPLLTQGNQKVIISWTNNYPVTTQISVQRSKDSTKILILFLPVADPKVPQNGFVDAKADGRQTCFTACSLCSTMANMYSPVQNAHSGIPSGNSE